MLYSGITTPYIIGDEMYCDGGVLNNFPADIIREDCDKLIGVFVSPPNEAKIKDLNSIKAIVSLLLRPSVLQNRKK